MLTLSNIQIFGIIVMISVSLFDIVLTIQVLRKFLVKKTKILANLTLMMIFMTLALLLDLVTFLATRNMSSIEAANAIITKQSVISLGLNAIGNVFLIRFTVQIFYKEHYQIWHYIVIILEIIVLPLGIVLTFNNIDALIVYAFHMVVSLILSFNLFFQALWLRMRLKAEVPKEIDSRNGVTYIGLSGIGLFLALFCFVLQEVARIFRDVFAPIGLIDQYDSSVFAVIAYLFAFTTIYLIYIGFIMPDWIKKIWHNK
jgi:hypothetical protein